MAKKYKKFLMPAGAVTGAAPAILR